MNRREVLKSAGRAALVAGLANPIVAEGRPSQATASSPAAHGDLRVRTRDGQELAVQDWGNSSPIVFLAAWALPSDMWAYQMIPLSEQGFRTVAYDRRGHGRSSRPGTGYDYDTLADDLAAVLDALDLRDVTLVGMSMAGGEMVRYVTRHGTGRLARLVFVSTASTPFLTRTPDNPAGIPLDRYLPYAAVVLDRYSNCLMGNGASGRLLRRFVDPSLLTGHANHLRVVFHPLGLRRVIVNWEEVYRHLWRRAERELGESEGDAVADAMLAELRGYAERGSTTTEVSTDDPGRLLLPIHIKSDDVELRLFTTLMTFWLPAGRHPGRTASRGLLSRRQRFRGAMASAHGERVGRKKPSSCSSRPPASPCRAASRRRP